MWEWFTPQTARAKLKKPHLKEVRFFFFWCRKRGVKKVRPKAELQGRPRAGPTKGFAPRTARAKTQKTAPQRGTVFRLFGAGSGKGRKKFVQWTNFKVVPCGSDQGVRPPNGTGKNSKNRTSKRHGFPTFWCRKRGSNPHGIATTGF